jgi:hypothetical protein
MVIIILTVSFFAGRSWDSSSCKIAAMTNVSVTCHCANVTSLLFATDFNVSTNGTARRRLKARVRPIPSCIIIIIIIIIIAIIMITTIISMNILITALPVRPSAPRCRATACPTAVPTLVGCSRRLSTTSRSSSSSPSSPSSPSSSSSSPPTPNLPPHHPPPPPGPAKRPKMPDDGLSDGGADFGGLMSEVSDNFRIIIIIIIIIIIVTSLPNPRPMMMM